MSDIVARLLEVASDHDKTEIGLVHNARLAAMRSYNEVPSKETKANWDASREAYAETVERLEAGYFPAEAKVVEAERFKNRKQALNWLQAQGYKCSQGKFYQDCEAGFPNINRDGSVSKYQVMQYGQQLDVERRGGVVLDYDRDADEARKLKAQADQEQMKAESMRREQDREWLHADQAWASVAAMVGAILDGLKHEFFAAQGEVVHLAAGDPARAPQVYEHCEAVIERAMNQAASHARLEVSFD